MTKTTKTTAPTTANEVSLFKFKDADVRVVDVSGQPGLLANDVFSILGYPKGSRTYQLNQLADGDKGVSKIQTRRGLQEMRTITESGLYKLVMRSDRPEAKDFQNWVTKVVLPAIRKDGGYVHGEEHVVSGDMSEDELVLKAMEVMKRKVDRLAAENAKMEAEIEAKLRNQSVDAYRAMLGQYWPHGIKTQMGQLAKSYCLINGLIFRHENREIRKANGSFINKPVHVFPVEALDHAAELLGVSA